MTVQTKALKMTEFDSPRESSSVLADIIRLFWRARAWFVYPALAGLLISIVVFVSFGLLAPSSTSYRYAISLTMPSAEDGRYPNGLPYAPTDLRSPAVLNEVFKRNQLDRFGINVREFSSMISVTSYSPVQEGITARFRNQLDDRGLTTEERRAIEDQFREALRQAKADGALVTFTIPDNLAISPELALTVVTSIPAVWSEYYTTVLGVDNRPIARSENELIELPVVENLDYPLAYDYVFDGLQRLSDRIDAILEIPGAKGAVVSESSVTAYDLQRKTVDIRNYSVARVLRPIVELGLSRDKELTTLSYNDMIEKLRLDENLARQRAVIVGRIVTEGTTADQQSRLSGPTDGTPSIGTTSIPQFGDDFIDRIIGLSLSGAGVEFRQELLRQKLQLEESAAQFARERENAERRLAAIQSFNQEEATMSTLSKRFVKVLDEVVAELNKLWVDTNSILATLSIRNLGGDKVIYSSLPIDQNVARTPFYASPFIWLLSFAIVLVFGIGGLVAYVLRATVIRRRA